MPSLCRASYCKRLLALLLGKMHIGSVSFCDHIDYSTVTKMLMLKIRMWSYFAALPRHVMFYDIIDYAYNRRITPSLSEELPTLLLPPLNPDVQLQHINILTRARYAFWHCCVENSSKQDRHSARWKNQLNKNFKLCVFSVILLSVLTILTMSRRYGCS